VECLIRCEKPSEQLRRCNLIFVSPTGVSDDKRRKIDCHSIDQLSMAVKTYQFEVSVGHLCEHRKQFVTV
jgi:hypothetical protein